MVLLDSALRFVRSEEAGWCTAEEFADLSSLLVSGAVIIGSVLGLVLIVLIDLGCLGPILAEDLPLAAWAGAPVVVNGAVLKMVESLACPRGYIDFRLIGATYVSLSMCQAVFTLILARAHPCVTTCAAICLLTSHPGLDTLEYGVLGPAVLVTLLLAAHVVDHWSLMRPLPFNS